MRRLSLPIIVIATAAVAFLAWPDAADAQRARARPRNRPAVRTTVLIGGSHYPVYGYRPYYRYYSPYWQYGPFWPYHYGIRDASGSVRIDVDPNDAEVYVDGYYAGIVDDFDNVLQRLHVRPGGHEIVVYLDGYRSLRYSIHVGPYSDQHIKAWMEPLAPGELPEPRPEPAAYEPPVDAPPSADQPQDRRSRRAPDRRTAVEVERFGSLAVIVQPVDAAITIDGEPWTVADGEVRLLVRLTEGRHRVEIQKEGYARYAEDVLIQVGRTLTLNVSLVRNGA